MLIRTVLGCQTRVLTVTRLHPSTCKGPAIEAAGHSSEPPFDVGVLQQQPKSSNAAQPRAINLLPEGSRKDYVGARRYPVQNKACCARLHALMFMTALPACCAAAVGELATLTHCLFVTVAVV